MERISDEELLRRWYKFRDMPVPDRDLKIWAALVNMITKIREQEPRINNEIHLEDYMNICDEDDDMDSFYGPDYWTN